MVAAASSSRSRVRSDLIRSVRDGASVAPFGPWAGVRPRLGELLGAGTPSPYRDGRAGPELLPRPPRLISCATMTLRWISLVPSPTIISGASRK